MHPTGVGITVMTHDGTQETGAFDERRVGLDHLAFKVANRDEMQRWATHLEVNGITHSGIIDSGYGPTLVFRDPDNIQLELFVQPDFADIQLTDADSAEAQRVLNESSKTSPARLNPKPAVAVRTSQRIASGQGCAARNVSFDKPTVICSTSKGWSSRTRSFPVSVRRPISAVWRANNRPKRG